MESGAHDFDVVIVGGGPAGLAAALVLGRMRREVLVCDTGEPENRVSHGVGGLLSRDGTPPVELREISREQIGAYASVAFREREVQGARALEPGFELEIGDERVTARKLLLAHGLNYARPPIEGIEELWGESVFHCPYCHGWEVRDSRIAVIVSSPRAANQALLLGSLTDELVVLANGTSELDDEALGRLERAGMEVVDDAIERVAPEGDGVRVEFADRPALERDNLFIQAELSLRSDIAQQLGATIADDCTIAVDASGGTDVPGLRAAGDCAAPPQSVAASIGSGSIAAYAINAELALERFESRGHENPST